MLVPWRGVGGRDAARQREQDNSRKARIGARLVHFVRRDDEAAEQILDQILKDLRPADRPAFAGWSAKADVKQDALPVVPISDRNLPRTIAEIDAEIERMTRHREQKLKDEVEENARHHNHRMIALGGGLLALVRDGSTEADRLLERIVAEIPAKQRAVFKNWDRPTAEAPDGDKGGAADEPTSGEPADGSLLQTGTASPAIGSRGQQRKGSAAATAVSGTGGPASKSWAPGDGTGDDQAEPCSDEAAGGGGDRPGITATPVASTDSASTRRTRR